MDMLRHAIECGESLNQYEMETHSYSIIEMLRSAATKKADSPALSEMLQMGARCNGIGDFGLSPLLFVLVRWPGDHDGMTAAVVSLLCAGADTEQVAPTDLVEMNWTHRHKAQGVCALTLAIQVGNMSAVEALLLAGASPDGPNLENVLSPLSVAAMWKEPAMVLLLLKRGAHPNKINYDGTVPMHHCGDTKTARILFDAGAALSIRDNCDRVPLHEWVERTTDPLPVQWLGELCPADRFLFDTAKRTPLMTLIERSKQDVTNSLWLCEIVAAWERDYILMKTDGAKSGSSDRRL